MYPGRARRGGGLAARRAVVRWAWRLVRHDWRSQVLVLGLLTVAVAAAVFGTTLAYNVAPSAAARFGQADLLLRVDGSDPAVRDGDLAAIEEFFGPAERIGHSYVRAPGSVETVELRAQEPDGHYGGPALALGTGRYPREADEVAITDAAAELLRVDVGDRLRLDHDWEVVGRVENPHDLDDEFVLVDSAGSEAEEITVLVAASPDKFDRFLQVTDSAWDHEWRGDHKDEAAIAVTALATLGMVLIGLMATAGFVVVAQRRQRQLGMMTALGATERHLRLVTLANGFVIGVGAAIAGTAVAVMAWGAAGHLLETAARQRIDRFDLPWWLIGQGLVLAVVTATAAAWWPARIVARVPVVQSLSARPPRPRSVRRSALAAAALVAVGVACLVRADRSSGQLVAAGIVAVVLGMLLLSPVALHAMGSVAQRSPVAPRVALRDLHRYQTRAGAALAAISLTLGIPAALVVSATAAEYPADEGNLSDRQLLIRAQDIEPDVALAPDRTPAEHAAMEAHVDRLAAELEDATVIPLEVALDPDQEPVTSFEGGEGGLRAVSLGSRMDEDTWHDVVAYVASPELLAYYGLAPADVAPGTQALTVLDEPLIFASAAHRQDPGPEWVEAALLDSPDYTSAPTTLLTVATVESYGWDTAPTGWLIETPSPLTSSQRAAAREVAASAGLTVETRFDPRGLAAIRDAVTVVGLLVALGILALTVGLLRSDAHRDVRTLTAVGASRNVRRTITAVVAGVLALVGSALGTTGAYVGLGAGFASDLEPFGRVPLAHLLVIVVGVPALAAGAGWLLGGREPPAMVRQSID